MREMIVEFFDEAVNELLGQYPELKTAVENSERKNKFIDNMCEQIKAIEKKRTKSLQKDGTFRLNLKREDIKKLVKDFVGMFGSLALKHKEQLAGIHPDHTKSTLWLPKQKKYVRKKRARGGMVERRSGILVPVGIALQ